MSARDRRAVVIGLAILVPLLAYRYAVQPYVARSAELQERIALESSLLARERALVEATAGFAARIEDLETEYAGRRAELLEGETRVEAEGALASYVAERAGTAGLLLQRSEGREGETADGPLAATSVLVQTLGDLEGVLRFLHALETGPLVLAVERLQLQPSPLRTADPGEAMPLQMGALITGFSIAAHPSSSAPDAEPVAQSPSVPTSIRPASDS